MTHADGTGATTASRLVSGPSPKRFERAAQTVAADTVLVVPGWRDAADVARETVDGADRTSIPVADGAAGDLDLSELGILISERIEELDGPDVLIALDAVARTRDADVLALFRFLHLTRRRVASAGGRLVCTLGEELHPITEETIAELFDERERLWSDRNDRAVGGLST